MSGWLYSVGFRHKDLVNDCDMLTRDYEKDVRSRRLRSSISELIGTNTDRYGETMKFKTLTILMLAAATCLCLAQEGPPPRELMLTKRIFLALRSNVKPEIKLSPDQNSRIMDAFGGGLEVEGDQIRLSLHGNRELAEMEGDAMKVLDASQRKRLEEIWIQRLDGIAIADDGVAKKVGLSAEQKKQADRLVEEGGTAISNLMADEPSPAKAKQFNEIRIKTGKQVLALLNEQQKKAFEELKGKPFDMKLKGQGT